jgi:hypothetical protein
MYSYIILISQPAVCGETTRRGAAFAFVPQQQTLASSLLATPVTYALRQAREELTLKFTQVCIPYNTSASRPSLP